MAKFKKYLKKKAVGKVVYNKERIIKDIVALSISEIENVYPYYTKHDSPTDKNYVVLIDKDTIYIKVAVKVHYTCCVTEIAFKVQEAIRHNVESMTPYRVVSVNVDVLEVFFDNAQHNEDVSQTEGNADNSEDNK